MEVVDLESRGAKFPEIQPLVSGQRGKKVYENGDVEAGIWTCGISVGLIHDIVSSLIALAEVYASYLSSAPIIFSPLVTILLPVSSCPSPL